MAALEFSVVIDVAMTETAREAHYVLPASSQYEKVEATFFDLEFPENVFYLRGPLLEPLPGTLPEPEIHRRLIRALGVYDDADIEPLRAAAEVGRPAFAAAFMAATASKPALAGVGAAVLFEALGPSLPAGMAGAAALWFSAQQCAMRYPDAVRAAGFDGDDPALGDALFDAILAGEDGVLFTRHRHDEAWDLIRTPDQKIQLEIPELLDELARLGASPASYLSDGFPFVLSAGERRSFTANTIVRDPSWRRKDPEGALRNGMGLDYAADGGEPKPTGVSPNELTSSDWCDPIAGTPWHKHVPARVEPLPA